MGSCEGVRCGGDKRCVLDAELGAHCVRCGACTVAGAPVCAVDGRTYAGICALRRAACERGKALPLAYKGPCIGTSNCASSTVRKTICLPSRWRNKKAYVHIRKARLLRSSSYSYFPRLYFVNYLIFILRAGSIDNVVRETLYSASGWLFKMFAYFFDAANATCATITCSAKQRCVSGGASGARCVSCGTCSGGSSRRPLCGTDAHTYPSWCRMQRAACHDGRVVDPMHPGPCTGGHDIKLIYKLYIKFENS